MRKDRQAGKTVRAVQEGGRGREVQGRLGRAVQGMADSSGRQEQIRLYKQAGWSGQGDQAE